jgi:hypothetical protein
LNGVWADAEPATMSMAATIEEDTRDFIAILPLAVFYADLAQIESLSHQSSRPSDERAIAREEREPGPISPHNVCCEMDLGSAARVFDPLRRPG